MARQKGKTPILVRPNNKFKGTNVEIVFKTYKKRSCLHWHDYYEMEIITGGSGTYYVNGFKHNIERGCVYLVAPCDFHQIEGDFTLVNIGFNENAISGDIVSAINSSDCSMVVRFSEEEFKELEALLPVLASEYSGEKPFCKLAMQALIDVILVHFMRKLATDDSEKSGSDIAVMRVVSFIKFNFRRRITLAEAAASVYLSPNYVGELFSKYMGVSFSTYLMRTRLNYARQLLLHGNTSIEDVALESGFSSQTYFSDCFRKQYGYTPTVLKKRVVSGMASAGEE